jgi:hypothetical protein
MKFVDKTLRDKTITVVGEFSYWPRHYLHSPVDIATVAGAQFSEKVDEDTDYVVVGAKRMKGKAAALKKAAQLQESGNDIKIIDEEQYIYMLRPDIRGAQFVFAGGFEYCPAYVVGNSSYSAVESIGATCAPAVTDQTNYLVIGGKRGKGKAAAENKAKKLIEQGHQIDQLSEEDFLELVSCNLDATQIDFQGLIIKLTNVAVGTRLQNALKMLQAEQLHLYSDIEEDRISGIALSQSGGGVYSCTLNSAGSYGCCDDNQGACMSAQGHTVCKHLLVLVLGLVKSGEFDAPTALEWLKRTQAKRPLQAESSTLAKTIVRYKGMQQGDLDWRPTETMPEDFMAY